MKPINTLAGCIWCVCECVEGVICHCALDTCVSLWVRHKRRRHIHCLGRAACVSVCVCACVRQKSKSYQNIPVVLKEGVKKVMTGSRLYYLQNTTSQHTKKAAQLWRKPHSVSAVEHTKHNHRRQWNSKPQNAITQHHNYITLPTDRSNLSHFKLTTSKLEMLKGSNTHFSLLFIVYLC